MNNKLEVFNMNEEISKILKMVEDGKINADKAQELIEAIGNKSEKTSVQLLQEDDIMNKMLKIRVNSHDGDLVNVNLPSFGISRKDEDYDFPLLYWIPKLQKSSYKQRFISGFHQAALKAFNFSCNYY